MQISDMQTHKVTSVLYIVGMDIVHVYDTMNVQYCTISYKKFNIVQYCTRIRYDECTILYIIKQKMQKLLTVLCPSDTAVPPLQ